MWASIAKIFTGGLLKSVENIALEAIQTDQERAEAKALFIKTLDPNGIMRRNLSTFACAAYGFYLFVMSCLVIGHFFFGEPTLVSEGVTTLSRTEGAMEAMTALFMPITTAWGAIVSASFGVNYQNAKQGR